MQIGARIGLGGLEVGGDADVPSGYTGVTLDAASGKYFPANATEWTALISQAGLSGIAVPDALHNCQDASGSLTDQIGAFPMTAAGTGSFSYQQTETGYTRKAITNPGTQLWRSTDAALPNSGTTSMLSLVIFRAVTGASAAIIQLGNFVVNQTSVNGTDKLRSYNGSIVDGVNAITGTVRPLSRRYNRTAGTSVGFSDTEKLTPTFSATGGKLLELHVSQGGAMLYAAHWFGAAAEVSDANWKTLLSALGWTVSWS